MTGLQWLNAVLLAATATMAVMLGVVCLLYGLYLDEAPQLREKWPMLVQAALLFSAWAVVSGLAFFSLLRGRPWRWYAQVALALTTAGSGWLLWQLLVG